MKFLSVAMAVIMVVGFVPLVTLPVANAYTNYSAKPHTKEYHYDAGTQFICSLVAGYDGSKLSTVKSQMSEAGYNCLDWDYASGTKNGKYIGIGYNTTDDPTLAITAPRFYSAGSSTSENTKTAAINGVNATFNRVNVAPEPTYRDGVVDFLAGVSKANYEYLYVTRDYDVGPAVTSIMGASSTTDISNAGYIAADSFQRMGQGWDTTISASGNDRFLGYKSTCTTVETSTLRSTYTTGITYYNNSSRYVSVTALTNALNTAQNILTDINDGYTTYTQTQINDAATAISTALNNLQVYVSFNANGGSGGGTDTVTVGTASSKTYTTSKTATRTGYTFKGWSSSSTATSGLTSFEACFNKTYYAVWSPVTYTVTYNGNGATGGSTAASTHTYDSAKALTSNGFTRAYTVTYNYNGSGAANTSATATYTFNGWNTNTSGTGNNYTNGQSVTNLASTQGANVNLYAKWTSASVTLPTPSRTGYTFGGWYKESACTNFVAGGGAAYTPTAATTLYAKWTINQYTITYKADDMKTVLKTETLDYGSTPTPPAIPAKAPDEDFHYAGE